MEIITILGKYYNNANQSCIIMGEHYIIVCIFIFFYTLHSNVMYAYSKQRKLYAINITHQISSLTFIMVFFICIFTLAVTKYQQPPKPIYMLHHIQLDIQKALLASYLGLLIDFDFNSFTGLLMFELQRSRCLNIVHIFGQTCTPYCCAITTNIKYISLFIQIYIMELFICVPNYILTS